MLKCCGFAHDDPDCENVYLSPYKNDIAEHKCALLSLNKSYY